MESALKTANSMEMAKKGLSQLHEDKPLDVEYINSKFRNKGKRSESNKKNNEGVKGEKGNVIHNKNVNRRGNSKITCYRCGKSHLAPRCTLPRSAKCTSCGGYGHLNIV